MDVADVLHLTSVFIVLQKKYIAGIPGDPGAKTPCSVGNFGLIPGRELDPTSCN